MVSQLGTTINTKGETPIFSPPLSFAQFMPVPTSDWTQKTGVLLDTFANAIILIVVIFGFIRAAKGFQTHRNRSKFKCFINKVFCIIFAMWFFSVSIWLLHNALLFDSLEGDNIPLDGYTNREVALVLVLLSEPLISIVYFLFTIAIQYRFSKVLKAVGKYRTVYQAFYILTGLIYINQFVTVSVEKICYFPSIRQSDTCASFLKGFKGYSVLSGIVLALT